MLLLLALPVAVVAGCGGSEQDPGDRGKPRHLRLEPGRYTFELGEDVSVGDAIMCIAADGTEAGGGFVPHPGEGVAASSGFSVSTSDAGAVGVRCPADPGQY